MSSKKRIAANRRNAKKSTGPKTSAGKAKSAQNATTHGLTAQRQVVLADEDPTAFNELRVELHLELAPGSQFEKLLVDRIVAVQWRLGRVPAVEAELLTSLRKDDVGLDVGLGGAWLRDAGPYGGALSRLARYEAMLERSLVRLLAELRRLQSARLRGERQSAEAWEEARESRSYDDCLAGKPFLPAAQPVGAARPHPPAPFSESEKGESDLALLRPSPIRRGAGSRSEPG
jgi:hypothetical protein